MEYGNEKTFAIEQDLLHRYHIERFQSIKCPLVFRTSTPIFFNIIINLLNFSTIKMYTNKSVSKNYKNNNSIIKNQENFRKKSKSFCHIFIGRDSNRNCPIILIVCFILFKKKFSKLVSSTHRSHPYHYSFDRSSI